MRRRPPGGRRRSRPASPPLSGRWQLTQCRSRGAPHAPRWLRGSTVEWQVEQESAVWQAAHRFRSIAAARPWPPFTRQLFRMVARRFRHVAARAPRLGGEARSLVAERATDRDLLRIAAHRLAVEILPKPVVVRRLRGHVAGRALGLRREGGAVVAHAAAFRDGFQIAANVGPVRRAPSAVVARGLGRAVARVAVSARRELRLAVAVVAALGRDCGAFSRWTTAAVVALSMPRRDWPAPRTRPLPFADVLRRGLVARGALGLRLLRFVALHAGVHVDEEVLRDGRALRDGPRGTRRTRPSSRCGPRG